MFSTEISTRDLLFSNPMDHFLGSDNELKVSRESGFGSNHSYNQSGASKLIDSQDLFTYTPRTDSESQYVSSNMDYQKYISQSLLMGKENSPRSWLSLENKMQSKKDLNYNAKSPLHTDDDEFKMKDIRTLISMLNDASKKLTMELSHNKDMVKDMKEEILKLNKNVSSVEEMFAKHVKILDESNKNQNCGKKQEDCMTFLRDTINENAENIKNLSSELKAYIERSNSKILERAKEFSDIQSLANEKFFQDNRVCSEHILKEMKIMGQRILDSLESSLENIQSRYEKKIDEKLNDLKTLFNVSFSTITKLISAEGTEAPHPVTCGRHITHKQSSNKSPETFKNISVDKFNNKLLINNNSSVTYQQFSCEESARPTSVLGCTHTPLILKRYRKPFACNKFTNNSISMPKHEPEASSYKTKLQYTFLNTSRKLPTSRSHIKSPGRNDFNIVNDFLRTPTASNIKTTTSCNDRFNFSTTGSQSTSSSPCLTIFEVTNLAKNSVSVDNRIF